MLKWLHEIGVPLQASVVAAENGHLEVFKWMKEINIIPRGTAFCNSAARGGHLKLLKWLRENGECDFDEHTCSGAAEGGHLELLKWLRENNCPWNGFTCESAAKRGHSELFKWVLEQGCPVNLATCISLVSRGHVEMLKWAREKRGFGWDSSLTTTAASNRQFETLKWLVEEGCSWSADVTTYAAKIGHLEMLKWAIEHGCPWGLYVPYYAVGLEDIELLRWAIEHGCPWGSTVSFRWDTDAPAVCKEAVKRGNLEGLKYARENGCDWDYLTCLRLAEHLKHEDIVDWIKKEEVFRPFDSPGMASLVSKIMWEAAELKYSPTDETLALLIPFHFVCKKWQSSVALLPGHRGDFAAVVASRGYLNLLKWGRENGCNWNSKTCTRAAEGGHMEVLKWARENGCPDSDVLPELKQ